MGGWGHARAPASRASFLPWPIAKPSLNIAVNQRPQTSRAVVERAARQRGRGGLGSGSEEDQRVSPALPPCSLRSPRASGRPRGAAGRPLAAFSPLPRPTWTSVGMRAGVPGPPRPRVPVQQCVSCAPGAHCLRRALRGCHPGTTRDEPADRSVLRTLGSPHRGARRVNVSLGPREERVLITGLHEVADIHCTGCGTVLGWAQGPRGLDIESVLWGHRSTAWLRPGPATGPAPLHHRCTARPTHRRLWAQP